MVGFAWRISAMVFSRSFRIGPHCNIALAILFVSSSIVGTPDEPLEISRTRLPKRSDETFTVESSQM